MVSIDPYRRVLAIRGVRSLLLVGIVARIPVTAISMTLTLHVVDGLRLGFTQAGLVGAASTGGVAVGSPLAGRLVDRHGLRPVVVVTTAAQLAFWGSAAFLPYWLLLAGAFAAGVLALPVFSVVRQCLAALVPAGRRRQAFALDSMIVEVSYMIGPAAAVAAVTAAGSRWTLALVGLGMVGAGMALFVLNPPTRAEDEPETAEGPVPRRRWLTPPVLALLGVSFAATFVLVATELGVVAMLKADGAAQWVGLVMAVWCFWSLSGGFVYGALPRGISPLVTIGAMAALTMPIGQVGHWPWLCLALLPAGMLCAPSMSTTLDALSAWVPAGARGEAMGLHGTALTLGVATSGPVTGAVIDHWGTGWSFAFAGFVGLVLVVLAVPVWRRASRPAAHADGGTAADAPLAEANAA